jgi:hypothetical protein
MTQNRLDAGYITKLMGADKRITPCLPLGLAQVFQIHKQPDAAEPIAAARDIRVIGNMEEFYNARGSQSQIIAVA